MRKKKESGATAFFGIFGLITVVALLIAAVMGWVLNVIKIVESASAENLEISTLFIVRCVGVIAAPLGAIVGWF
jgi:integral membrane sensor domain MASE1